MVVRHIKLLDVYGGELIDLQLFFDLDIHGLSKPFPITGVCWDMASGIAWLARGAERNWLENRELTF